MIKVFLFFAIFSTLWNYSIPRRYREYEAGTRTGGKRAYRLLLMDLARKTGIKGIRYLVLFFLVFGWLILTGYFVTVSVYFDTYGLNAAAAMTAILTTIALLKDMQSVHTNFLQWCYEQDDTVLDVTRGCWEMILAGLVLVRIFLYP
ncbi:Hypothetical protein LUCI_3973 [Lucifera butyrica]|uniref:Uncharacterized protein n=1 Tax=Lucifera butyrica TaxID=1351585 RepID=A0A498RCF4_9FIRM|nr:hypothetical protein [Lucifera butyrica]VBB08695.1 Hypothetical protein LUCI_3973 [Lucifera butyrica]